jgi:hypothetical protein
MFIQSDRIRDYVFPVVAAERPPSGPWVFERFLGTGFLIGRRGFGITAAHIVKALAARPVALFAPDSGGWDGYDVSVHQCHPTEDIALISLSGERWRSFFRLRDTRETAGCQYKMFGYPEDALYDLAALGSGSLRPDMIYTQGYVRRRLSRIPLPGISGSHFLELSDVAGSGCSGSPVFTIDRAEGTIWDVFGVYTGERLNDRATSVAYAVATDSFVRWCPSALGGRTVGDESTDVGQGA